MTFALYIKNLTTFTYNAAKFVPQHPRVCTLGDLGIESTWFSLACSIVKDPIQPKTQPQTPMPH